MIQHNKIYSNMIFPLISLSRLAMRRDTCALVAISLNMSEKVHPVIWQLGSLPFDCYSVLAVPKPISK